MKINKGFLTIEDCVTLCNAGYEVYINDGLVSTNYKDEDIDIYHNIPSDWATPIE